MAFRSTVDDIREYARTLGFSLSPSEITNMLTAVNESLFALEAFNDLDVEAHGPNLKYPNRDPGRKATRQEDPLNAFIWMCRITGADHGLLAGKTVGVKDHTSVAGIPLSLGMRLMDNFVPDFDATIVTRILDAGGTIVGKMNMHRPFENGEYGRVLNPHNHAYEAGGSSSGSSAAVAGGFVDIAFGGDQGGSIRTPSSWCGVLGLMPSWGLVPHTGIFGYDPTVDFTGPIARSTEDLAAALQTVAGPDGFDPRQDAVAAEPPRYTRIVEDGIERLKIGLLSEGFGYEGSEADVEEAVLDALGVLEKAGASLVRVSAPLHDKAVFVRRVLFAEGYKRFYDSNLGGSFAKTFYPTSLIAAFGRAKKNHGHRVPYHDKVSLLVGAHLEHEHYGMMYAKAQNLRPSFVRQYDELFSGVDLIAMPTVPIKAPRYDEAKPADARALDLELVVRNTCPFNLTGHPAITIPCAKSLGLPVGLMLVAPRFREDRLLRAAYAYQHSVDWWSRFTVAEQPPARVPRSESQSGRRLDQSAASMDETG